MPLKFVEPSPFIDPVRQDDDQPIASFEFASEAAAQAAQKQMQEILATCVKAMGYA